MFGFFPFRHFLCWKHCLSRNEQSATEWILCASVWFVSDEQPKLARVSFFFHPWVTIRRCPLLSLIIYRAHSGLTSQVARGADRQESAALAHVSQQGGGTRRGRQRRWRQQQQLQQGMHMRTKCVHACVNDPTAWGCLWVSHQPTAQVSGFSGALHHTTCFSSLASNGPATQWADESVANAQTTLWK